MGSNFYLCVQVTLPVTQTKNGTWIQRNRQLIEFLRVSAVRVRGNLPASEPNDGCT
jgi:hypothetical protein